MNIYIQEWMYRSAVWNDVALNVHGLDQRKSE